MSHHNNPDYLISRYNFSRRVIDHRVPHDLNFAVNSPVMSKAWLGKAKQRMIGSLIYYFGAYVSGAAIVISFTGVLAEAYLRPSDLKPSIVTAPRFTTPTEKFLFQNKNKTNQDLGYWNHNFSCWSSEKNCGRDLNWYRKPEAAQSE